MSRRGFFFYLCCCDFDASSVVLFVQKVVFFFPGPTGTAPARVDYSSTRCGAYDSTTAVRHLSKLTPQTRSALTYPYTTSGRALLRESYCCESSPPPQHPPSRKKLRLTVNQLQAKACRNSVSPDHLLYIRHACSSLRYRPLDDYHTRGQ